ncbi:hypothetical protein [Devosia sp. RR2S18]|jgi:hypothetical protein|uniref:hypothetical protein n=1 Tax=Devosia rhizosphaerae TaxID=3049774 RepID=UPI00253FB6CA|nr:hypothetical protein [Devosia sp. RR2S18]WIJ24702.1 hypothetical protein QOV41_17060 [Devosia sp. RR2S18]
MVAETQAMKLALKALIEVMANAGQLDRERWNDLLGSMAANIGNMELEKDPQGAELLRETVAAVDFYKIEERQTDNSN